MTRLARFSVSISSCVAVVAVAGGAAAQREPIIDVHLHAVPADYFGTPPRYACAVELTFSPRDPRDPFSSFPGADCRSPLVSPMSDEEMLERTLSFLRQYNMTGILSGFTKLMLEWKAAEPRRLLLSAASLPVDSVRVLATNGTIDVIGELTLQLGGRGASDSLADRYYALAEELDMPLGVHIGLGPPGAAYDFARNYRMSLSNPLLLEEALLRHPRLRVYVMHAGWPMIDEMIGLLYAHPQVYVDVAVINWFLPRQEFHAYLRRLVDAGFGKRIMFGSDQMAWPDAIPIAIESIESAPFLTHEQKRDIMFNNAVRFFRFDAAQFSR